MKVTPIPSSNGGNPSNAITPSEGHISSEALQRAKAIAAGGSNISVTPSDTPIDPQVARAQASIRKIRMKTNVSPDRFNPVLEAAAAAAAAESVPGAESATIDPIEQVNATVEDTKPLSPQFAALARQRRALQVKERELADREKAISSTPKESNIEARLKSEPLRVLQEAGVTYDQLTEAILADQSGINPEIQALRNEIKALKEGVDKNLSDRDAQAEQAVLAEMMKEAEQLTKEGDTYEMVREFKSLPDVKELILRTYKQTGEVLDVAEALQLVEDDLLSENLKIANIKKIQSRLNSTQDSSVQDNNLQIQSKQMKTLTSRDGATQLLSRRDRAIAAMKGTLKK